LRDQIGARYNLVADEVDTRSPIKVDADFSLISSPSICYAEYVSSAGFSHHHHPPSNNFISPEWDHGGLSLTMITLLGKCFRPSKSQDLFLFSRACLELTSSRKLRERCKRESRQIAGTTSRT